MSLLPPISCPPVYLCTTQDEHWCILVFPTALPASEISLLFTYLEVWLSVKAQSGLQYFRKPSPPIPLTGNWTQGLALTRLSCRPHLETVWTAVLCPTLSMLLSREKVYTVRITAETHYHVNNYYTKDGTKGTLGWDLSTHVTSSVPHKKPGEMTSLSLFFQWETEP